MDFPTFKRAGDVKTKIVTDVDFGDGLDADVATDRRDDDAIVFMESNVPSHLDSRPLRKVAVVSGASKKIIGMQG